MEYLKKFWWIGLLVLIVTILIILFAKDFNKRYNALSETIKYQLVLKSENTQYSIYGGKQEFIIKNDILPYEKTNIVITLQKTNNLFKYLGAGLNKNATVIWKNGILYELKEIKNGI